MCWFTAAAPSSTPLSQPVQHVESQRGPLAPQQEPGVLHGAGELGQGGQGVQGMLGAQSLGSGPGGQRLDPSVLVQPGASRSRPEDGDEGAEVSVKQLHPLDGLGPQVQVALLEQELLFVLGARERRFIRWCVCAATSDMILFLTTKMSGLP